MLNNMANTYTQIHIHAVFLVQNRFSWQEGYGAFSYVTFLNLLIQIISYLTVLDVNNKIYYLPIYGSYRDLRKTRSRIERLQRLQDV